MDLIGYVKRTAPSMSHGKFACLVGSQVPRDVWIFGVLLQLGRSQGTADEVELDHKSFRGSVCMTAKSTHAVACVILFNPDV